MPTLPPFPDIPSIPGTPQVVRDLTSKVTQVPQDITSMINTIARIPGLPPGVLSIITAGPPNPAMLAALLGFPGIPPIVSRLITLYKAQFVTPDTKKLSQTLAPSAKNVYGIYDKDAYLVLEPDNITEIHPTEKSVVSKFPTERGAFADYNKVAEPYEISVTMTKGGKQSDMNDFMDQLRALKEGIQLVDIVTPERVFLDANLETFDYSKTVGKGQNLLIIKAKFIEIWQVEPVYVNSVLPPGKPKNPSGTTKKDKGKEAQTAADKWVADKIEQAKKSAAAGSAVYGAGG